MSPLLSSSFMVSVAAASLINLSSTANAEGLYFGASGSINFQTGSDNAGQTGAFATGNGAPALPFGTAITAGTDYGWDTDFGTGWGAALEGGYQYDNGFRAALEIVFSRAGVDSHEGVTVGGTAIDGVDAAVLTGSETQLGASVGAIVADGQGRIRNFGAFANIYYDFPIDAPIKPYVGAGIGYMDVDVEYSPSAVGILNDSQGKLAYQAKVGATFALSDNIGLFTEAAYRATGDVELENDLFPGGLDVENQQILVSLGARFGF